MATVVSHSVRARRDADLVAKLVTDPNHLLPVMGGFGRFEPVAVEADGCGEWDLFLDIGVIHVGGRVVVRKPDGSSLVWESSRGTRHSLAVTATPAGLDTEIRMTISYELAGAVTGAIGERLARGMVSRHIVAGLEQLRHHVEHEL